MVLFITCGGRRSAFDGKGKGEAAAFPGFTFDPDAPLIVLNDFLADGKPEAGPIRFFRDRIASLMELVENSREILLWNSHPRILHMDTNKGLIFVAEAPALDPLRRKIDGPPGRGEFDGIGKQVTDYLINPVLVQV